ncbi:NADP-dependent aldehyde dehydrogenase [Pedobacter sp. ok626]|uniref:aldehyde dehydrogenase (NADP(+)) n=1 Tax=Pedobacter sp. ok626 TaxID=1761882 RepID=UPI0008864CB1|nr:aldehyde dehydrogenase (NADP(+)) [Pedobacter sp. ok626]SDL06569.1 NADP-dependent aldehyde dehydrogenase [Pedobacter sp. ok626]
MNLTGKQIIGNDLAGGGTNSFQAINPKNGEKLATAFLEATATEVEAAAVKASQAFQLYRVKSGEERALFLETIASEIEALGPELIERCVSESGLPVGRIEGERGRTMGQLLLFAQFLREGSWVQATIDTAMPDRKPLPKPDIRSMQKALGPVLVFGASNFPLAFSVAGGDTVSALAAGCPVIVKAHPAHPGTCELIATAIISAAKKTNMPDGVFSMLHGGIAIGTSLVMRPEIKAIGFTGSYTGGKAIFDAAASRAEPIPVYAEMGSVNPVFVLPGAIKDTADSIAQGFSNSVNLGVGQFCTNPGMLLLQRSAESNSFLNQVAIEFAASSGGTMLTPGIQSAYTKRTAQTKSLNGVKLLAEGKTSEDFTGVTPALFYTNVQNLQQHESLAEENFGPSSIIVQAEEKEDLLKIASELSGHLTATVFGTPEDLETYKELLYILEQKAGRLIINTFPTGVEVTHAMVHGGPFPATTNASSTSVGTNAIYRFTRPVAYQGFSEALLPAELKDSNPLNITRKINGKWKGF